ncbi:LEAF RUST 10 DISEASE-RESISTANCE LOCUS RECEPTOR-LIKE PROTEIN KINASE-like 2.5 [Asparagus officinalis]|uniref:LEAF RUST 10 DISEASE-RESISTANCE LOCUS RECEPTOR-LIKE PROTEIN KINASE-like 2.5 n=1 Tax=Asparagus officinalis TaxID=4686 RepID=UPI00098E6143|nr:LEAF RUST 10 DISEASE-RESISTANCE LOCUS RECEPTOR-LIKE PROTEIN KINASE-like 2.5 [Asparagus officinalis]
MIAQHSGISIGTASFLIGSLLFILLFRRQKISYGLLSWKKKAKHAQTIEAFLKKYHSLATKRYAYSDIKKITKSFSEKLGQGGYGSVYKGKLFDGNLVAVKVLDETKSNGEDFINEVAAIGNTSHINIVTLRGFCVDGSKRALIYDFMPNGSLEKYICSMKKPMGEASIGWEKLYEIVVGIARGLEYLHRGCNNRIVHFDIKPHNILLDKDFCPKIADFGMSKLCPPQQSIVSMYGARGTIGYIAPEVFSRSFGVVSSKSDVYSYGMMILHIFEGKNSTNTRFESNSEAYFPQSIYQHIDNADYLKEIGVTNETEEIARKMLIVGFWCIQTMPGDRPSMTRVVDMLEGDTDELSIPQKPVLASPLDSIPDPALHPLLEIYKLEVSSSLVSSTNGKVEPLEIGLTGLSSPTPD